MILAGNSSPELVTTTTSAPPAGRLWAAVITRSDVRTTPEPTDCVPPGVLIFTATTLAATAVPTRSATA